MSACTTCGASLEPTKTARVRFHLTGVALAPGRPKDAVGKRTWKVCHTCAESLRILLAAHGAQVLKELVQSLGGDS